MEKTVADDVDSVVLDLPPCLHLADTINILNHTMAGGKVVVKEIDRASLSEYDYFGVVVATTEPFEDLSRDVPVKVSFLMKDGSADTHVAPVRIFRPRLEFDDAPDTLTLKNVEHGEYSIPIRLKFSGFGDITVRCRCTIGGRLVSYGTSLMDEILRRIMRGGMANRGPNTGPGPRVEVDPSQVQLVTEEFRDKMLSDPSARRMLDNGAIDHDTALFLHNLADSDKEEVAEHVYKTLSMAIANILADILARTLGENLQLESKTAIMPPVELPMDELVVEFQYSDVLGNKYAPIQKSIKIVDRRAEKTGTGLEIPLSITADESGAYQNVAGMRLGTHD